MNLWEEFREYLIREGVVDDVEDAENYMAGYLGRSDFEDLDDDLWHFTGFLREQFVKRFGEVEGLDFLEHVDSGYKYNEVRVIKEVVIGKYKYSVVVNVYDCKWGVVAGSIEEFNVNVDNFLRETKERLDNLLQNINFSD
jgi:hypothetical protein